MKMSYFCRKRLIFHMRIRTKIGLLLLLLAQSCQTEFHPYDTRIKGETGINDKNIARIETATAGKEAIRFAVISDTHRWYDETRDAVKALNRRSDLDFVIHTGDVVDFGMRSEFERQRDNLNRLHVPYVCIIGNHDCIATGEIIFEHIFGAFNYTFTAGPVRFVCLNTNALEFDHDETVPNFDFIETQLADSVGQARKTIVVMHAQPYSDEFDNGVAKIFEYFVKRFPGIQFCLHGHGHQVQIAEPFNDGIKYYECACISKRSYLLFTLNEEGYQYECVQF